MITPRVRLGPMSRRGAEICCEIYLVQPNVQLIRAAGLPRLYSSGTHYEREDPGEEEWKNARELLRTKRGDCEDLASYLAAELRVYDKLDARVVIRPNRMGGYHAVVEVNGRILDPSAKLGM
jgi:hypothetical protein